MIEKIIVYGLASASLTLTLQKGKLPILQETRNYLRRKSKLIDKLFTCNYCMLHWVNFIMIWIFEGLHKNVAIIWFAVICVSAIVINILESSIRGTAHGS